VAGASARTEGIADGLVGKPWGAQAAIKDSSGTRRETGEGELVIKSPSAMSGYLRRPDLTAAVLSTAGIILETPVTSMKLASSG
jgi:oxalate---CoA ligase